MYFFPKRTTDRKKNVDATIIPRIPFTMSCPEDIMVFIPSGQSISPT